MQRKLNLKVLVVMFTLMRIETLNMMILDWMRRTNIPVSIVGETNYLLN